MKSNPSKPNHLLSKAEFQQALASKEAKKETFDGVEDVDDVDPEGEFHAWKRREAQRKQRDEQRDEEEEEDGEGRKVNNGAFYRDVDERLVKREFRDVEGGSGEGDHSRPTRFKPGR